MAGTTTTNPQTTVQKNIAQQQQSQYATQNGMNAPGTQNSQPAGQAQGTSPVTPTGQIAPQPTVGAQASPSLGGNQSPSPTPQIAVGPGSFQGGTGVQNMPTQALAQQQPIQQQQVGAYNPTQFQQSGLANPTQQALLQAIQNPLINQNMVNQMKGANRDVAAKMQKQFGGQVANAAAQRGLSGGVVDAGNRAAQSEALKQVLEGNRSIDLAVPQQNFAAQMQAIGAGQGQQQLDQGFQQAQADENLKGWNTGLDTAKFNIDQQVANADVGQKNASQALDAWTKYNTLSSDNANQAAARALQEKLGMTGLSNDMTLGKGDQAIRLLGTLMSNNQAANSLGYQYTALNAAQQQAMMNAILGGR